MHVKVFFQLSMFCGSWIFVVIHNHWLLKRNFSRLLVSLIWLQAPSVLAIPLAKANRITLHCILFFPIKNESYLKILSLQILIYLRHILLRNTEQCNAYHERATWSYHYCLSFSLFDFLFFFLISAKGLCLLYLGCLVVNGCWEDYFIILFLKSKLKA